MHVVHVLNSIHLILGGPPRSVTGLCGALAREGCQVDLCTTDIGGRYGQMVDVDPGLFGLHHVPSLALFRLGLYFPRGFRSLLRKVSESADVIHSHSMWLTVNRIAAEVARERGIPHVISPRGTLARHCLGHRAWKKRLVARLWQDRALREAACICVTADMERQYVREYGLANPVATVPIGISLEPFRTFSAEAARLALEARWPEIAGRRVMLFLSRLSPIKGLAYLAEAWGAVCKDHPDWHLLIAGPNERDYAPQVQQMIDAAGAGSQTTMIGSVSGDLRLQCYAGCDLFVLPSNSENFGIVIAEAMASGKPVVTTQGTPWQSLTEQNAGWWIPIGTAALTDALRDALRIPPEELHEMGSRGRGIIERNFAWPVVAREMTGVYKWLAGGGDRPECIDTASPAGSQTRSPAT